MAFTGTGMFLMIININVHAKSISSIGICLFVLNNQKMAILCLFLLQINYE